MSWFLQGQKKNIIFELNKIIRDFFILRLGCELCVYGQGETEFEMITQISFRTQLGASLD